MIKVYYTSISALDDNKIYDYCKSHAIGIGSKGTLHNDSLLAHALLYEALCIENIDASALTYMIDDNKCPYFKEKPSLSFSLSHSNDYVICAISDEGRLGCDIEKIKQPYIKCHKIAKRFYHESELKILSDTDENNYPSVFYRLWTLKESVMKITGLGMKLPTGAIAFNLPILSESSCPSLSYISSDYKKYMPSNLYFKEFNTINGYAISLCCESSISDTDVIFYDFSRLL